MDLLPLPDWEVGRLRLSRSLSKKRTGRGERKGSLCQDPVHACASPLLLEKNSKHSLCRVVVCFIVEPERTASAFRLNGTAKQWFAFFFSFLSIIVNLFGYIKLTFKVLF